MKTTIQIEHVFAVGLALLIPVFLLGVVATWRENALALEFAFACFGVAGVVWIWREVPALLARLACAAGLGRARLGDASSSLELD